MDQRYSGREMVMKIVDAKCPCCGAQLNVDLGKKLATCEFCGTRFVVDDEVQRLKIVGAEKAGYEFEKGRQRAQAEAAMNQWQPVAAVNETGPKKRRIWLWTLGWICIFPVPLTILMLRNHTMDKRIKYGIIAAGWLAYIVMGVSGNRS